MAADLPPSAATDAAHAATMERGVDGEVDGGSETQAMGSVATLAASDWPARPAAAPVRLVDGPPLSTPSVLLGRLSVLGRARGDSPARAIPRSTAERRAAVERHVPGPYVAANDASSPERASDLLARIQRLCADLAAAVEPDRVARAIVGAGQAALAADAGALFLVENGAAAPLDSDGWQERAADRFERVPLTARDPVAACVQARESLFLSRRAEYADRFEAPLGARARDGEGAIACVPLVVAGRALGAVAWTFDGARAFSPDERAFVHAIAQVGAQALARARLDDNERMARDRAAAALRARDEFLAIAGHELKTPLTALSLHLAALLRGGSAQRSAAPLDDRAQKRVALSLRQADRLAALVDDVVDGARFTSREVELDRTECDLAAITRDVVTRLAGDAERAGCVVTLDVPAPGVARGSWDRARIERVVAALLANAFKYGAGRPVAIAVTTAPRADGDGRGWVRLTVLDRGVGIDSEQQARIFERFGRAASRNYGGLGLGLWLVERIASAHGGRVAVESRPGEGARFEVLLPS